MAGFEITNPGDGLSPQRVKISIVPDREGNIAPIFGKHESCAAGMRRADTTAPRPPPPEHRPSLARHAATAATSVAIGQSIRSRMPSRLRPRELRLYSNFGESFRFC